MAGTLWRYKALRAASAVQTVTAATLGSVLVVHLASPVVAALGGVDLANQTMVRGARAASDAALGPRIVPTSTRGAAAGMGIARTARWLIFGAPCTASALKGDAALALVVRDMAQRGGLCTDACFARAHLAEPICAGAQRGAYLCALSLRARLVVCGLWSE